MLTYLKDAVTDRPLVEYVSSHTDSLQNWNPGLHLGRPTPDQVLAAGEALFFMGSSGQVASDLRAGGSNFNVSTPGTSNLGLRVESTTVRAGAKGIAKRLKTFGEKYRGAGGLLPSFHRHEWGGTNKESRWSAFKRGAENFGGRQKGIATELATILKRTSVGNELQFVMIFNCDTAGVCSGDVGLALIRNTLTATELASWVELCE